MVTSSWMVEHRWIRCLKLLPSRTSLMNTWITWFWKWFLIVFFSNAVRYLQRINLAVRHVAKSKIFLIALFHFQSHSTILGDDVVNGGQFGSVANDRIVHYPGPLVRNLDELISKNLRVLKYTTSVRFAYYVRPCVDLRWEKSPSCPPKSSGLHVFLHVACSNCACNNYFAKIEVNVLCVWNAQQIRRAG